MIYLLRRYFSVSPEVLSISYYYHFVQVKKKIISVNYDTTVNYAYYNSTHNSIKTDIRNYLLPNVVIKIYEYLVIQIKYTSYIYSCKQTCSNFIVGDGVLMW